MNNQGLDVLKTLTNLLSQTQQQSGLGYKTGQDQTIQLLGLIGKMQPKRVSEKEKAETELLRTRNKLFKEPVVEDKALQNLLTTYTKYQQDRDELYNRIQQKSQFFEKTYKTKLQDISMDSPLWKDLKSGWQLDYKKIVDWSKELTKKEQELSIFGEKIKRFQGIKSEQSSSLGSVMPKEATYNPETGDFE